MAKPNAPAYDERAGLDPPAYDDLSVLDPSVYDEKAEVDPPAYGNKETVASSRAPTGEKEPPTSKGLVHGDLEG